MKRHKLVVGVIGSAFHTMLFSGESKNSTYICRDFDINVNYFMVDEIMRNNSVYIDDDDPSAERETRNYGDDTTLNLDKIFNFLEKAEVLQP
jgi:hypothetical protein